MEKSRQKPMGTSIKQILSVTMSESITDGVINRLTDIIGLGTNDVIYKYDTNDKKWYEL